MCLAQTAPNAHKKIGQVEDSKRAHKHVGKGLLGKRKAKDGCVSNKLGNYGDILNLRCEGIGESIE